MTNLVRMRQVVFYGLALVGALAVVWYVGMVVFNVTTYRSNDYGATSGSYGMAPQVATTLSGGGSNGLGFMDSLVAQKRVLTAPGAPVQSREVNVAYAEGELTQRKVVRDGSLGILVDKAEPAAESIKQIAAELNGFVSDANVYEVSDGVKAGTVTVRVPADKYDEALTRIKKLATKVERESANAKDVTEQFVDLTAHLKNFQAEETQYLEIMKRAVTVADTLQVSQRLAEVRGQIEQIQGQLKYLSSQVDMSTITVSLTSEADVQVFGLTWHPLVVAKRAVRSLITGLTGYVDTMIAFIMVLPVIILWLATLAVILYIVWRSALTVRRKFFFPKQ